MTTTKDRFGFHNEATVSEYAGWLNPEDGKLYQVGKWLCHIESVDKNGVRHFISSTLHPTKEDAERKAQKNKALIIRSQSKGKGDHAIQT